MSDEKRRIIGGEFAISHELTISNGTNLQTADNTYYYSSGRCALFAILSDIKHTFGKIGGVLLPNYLCDSITNTVVDAGWKYCFYHIRKDFHIDFDALGQITLENKVVLLIDYFGMTDLTNDIENIRSRFPNAIIIADCVQAFYSMGKYEADYSFTSFRKWFPCPDGAMVIKKYKEGMTKIDLKESNWWKYKYAGNILKEYSCLVSDSIALELLDKGEELLDKSYLCEWNEESKRIFHSIDKVKIRNRRKRNAKYLHQHLEALNIDHYYSEEGTPLFLPILVENRDQLRKAFFVDSIFTPKHWPVINTNINGENVLYRRELSLICDQRYDLDDMERQIKVIKSIRGMIL